MLKFLKKILGFKEAAVPEVVAPYKIEVSQEDPLKRAVEPIAAVTVTPEIVVQYKVEAPSAQPALDDIRRSNQSAERGILTTSTTAVSDKVTPKVKPSKKPATKNPAANKSRGRKPKPKMPSVPKAQ